jgi:hypothetical protein
LTSRRSRAYTPRSLQPGTWTGLQGPRPPVGMRPTGLPVQQQDRKGPRADDQARRE